MNNQLVPFVPHDFGSAEQFMQSIDPMAYRNGQETKYIRDIGLAIGFGRVMQLAQQEWRRVVAAEGLAGSEHSTGPCVIMTYVCGCILNHSNRNCDWCCGAGWLTKKVRELQIASGE